MLRLPEVPLEEWMRRYYFDVDVDIGSSGVANFSLGELRDLLGITQEELDGVVFHDSTTLGGQGLRQAIADRWAGGDADRVMVTHGSTEANYLVMTTLLDPGDEIVVLDPLYQQLYSLAEAWGCRLRRWPMRFERGFRPDLDELEPLVGPATRMIVVNFPHNPTGVSLTPAEQERLISLAAGTGAYLYWDAAFSELVYQGDPLPDPCRTYERCISTGTFSKAYGLPGLRVGWCLAEPEVLERFIRMRDYTLLHLSPLIELIARRGIEKADTLVAIRLGEARTNLGRLAAWIEERSPVVEWVEPDGGVTAFVRLPGVEDVDLLCHTLARDHRVLLVPGSCFGQPQHVRLGFGCHGAELELGLDALGAELGRSAERRATAL